MSKKLLLSFLVVTIALAVIVVANRQIPLVDSFSDTYFKETTTQAALAYATVRGVNGVVSVLKESQVELSPAGIGVSIAAGQILDPIDDMTERLSTVIVTALVSLGLQKLISEIGAAVPGYYVAMFVLFLLIPIWLPRPHKDRYLAVLLKIYFLLLILRLIMPVSALVSDSLYRQLLKPEIIQAEQQLASIFPGHDQLRNFNDFADSESISSFSVAAKDRLEQAKSLFSKISDNVETIIEALLQLTTMYVSLFILQVIMIPVAL
ncbi:MAG: hypothetical protein KJO32_01630, partial [Deltaproteobacteria bacterium]|nr:hypothetical protein [Deltaproteobacteria bacterium]